MAGEPQVNPNALGAPAEGFGQTVSFAYDPRGTAPPLVRPTTSSGPRVGVSGGGSPGGPQVNPNSVRVEQANDPTAALLMKVGGEMLNSKIEEARSAQYVEGMQRAMSGEGIKEVRDSVPWYARLFGETPMEAGASAYTAQDVVNKTITEQTANMSKLAQLGPQEAAKHFNDMMKSSMTGDSQTDAVIMKGLSEQLPSLMKVQAKANYGWKQAKAAQAMGSAMSSGASQVQAFGESYASDGMTDADFQAVKDQYVASVLPPAGIDEEHYQKALTSNLLGAAQRGEFHAIEALRSSGVLNALTADQSNRVEAAITAGAKRQRNNYAAKYVDVMAEIESDAKTPPGGSTPKELKARIESAEAAFKKLTGNPEGLWSSDEKKDMLEGTLNAFKAADKETARAAQVIADKNSTEAAKAQAQVAMQQRIESYVSRGQAALVKMMDGVKSDDVDLAVYTMAKKDPEAGAKMLRLNWANGTVSKLISNEIQSGLNMAAADFTSGRSTAPPDTFFESVNAYRTMEQQGGTAFANAYFGEHAKAMAFASKRLGNQVLGNPNAGTIYNQAMQVKDFRGERMPQKEQQALVKKVISEGKSWLPKWAGGASLRDDAARRLAEEVQDGVQQWKLTGKSDEEATAMALNDILGPKNEAGERTGGAGAEIIGGFMIKRTPGSSVDTLATLMNGKGQNYTEVPADLKGEIFEGFMKEHVKMPDAGTVDITRVTDVAGTARFQVSYVDKDGVSGLRAFSADELSTYAREQTKWKRLPRFNNRGITTEETATFNAEKARMEATPVQPIQTTFGPKINYTPSDYAKGVALARQQVIDSQKTKRK